MGACVSSPAFQKSDKELKACPRSRKSSFRELKPDSKFKELELNLLQLLYDDLAQRCNGQIVSRDTFQVFFNNSGLMAELMFSKFDEQKTGTILKEEFFKAFEINVKGSFKQRANALFQFYSMEKAGGICYAELLRILLSYPLEKLNTMVFEQKFLKELGDFMITYYFGPEKKIEDKIDLEQQSEMSSHDLSFQPVSLYHPTSEEGIQIRGRIQKIMEEERNHKKKLTLPPLFKKQQMSLTNANNNRNRFMETELLMKKAGSMSLIEVKKIRKSCKLKSNITSVAKKYANFLFTSANLDKEKDVFSKEQFCELLRSHPSIFDVYLAGFHTQIWQVEANGRPKYASVSANMEGSCNMLVNNSTTLVYLKLIKNTIIVFDNDKKNGNPKSIINLEGLIVQKGEEYGEKFVKLRHRDTYYPQKTLTFPQKQKEWLEQMEYFKQISTITDYVRLERIGKGNFSTVYKCKSKTTGEIAALKIIDLLKLNPNERQVLKRQIGILKQCRDKNIVKFIKEYKTQNRVYIVTQICSEGDLFDYTRKKGFIEEYEAALIFRQLTQAILYLNNELGIIHRDLKPENIMIMMTEDKKMVNRVKIIDFGFGVYKAQLSELSQEEKFAGTPGFLAPQVLQSKEYDEKIDTFSLGIILYFMLYGYLPFQSNYFEQIRDMTLSCNINLENNHWSNVSQEAKDLIKKILTFSDKRISTKQILDHPWLRNIHRLKTYEGKNKKRVKILN